MKDDQTKRERGQASEKLTPSASNTEANRQADGSKKSPKSPKENKQSKKWTLKEHWNRASRRQQLIWLLKGIGGFIAASGAIVTAIYYVASYIQSQKHFVEEHRPKIVFSRPPELIPISGFYPPPPGRVMCKITDKAIHLSVASLRFWIGNSGGDAKDVFIPSITAKLVPEQATNNPEFDQPPIVTDDTCKKRGKPMIKEIPLGSRLQTPLDVRQVVEVFPLFKMKSGSITIDTQGSDPIPPPDLKPSDWTHIAPDAVLQLYIVACVDYSDKDGAAYASCATYRFMANGRQNILNPYGFSCQETPLAGTFQPIFGGYCEE